MQKITMLSSLKWIKKCQCFTNTSSRYQWQKYQNSYWEEIKTVTAIFHDNQRGKHKNPPTVDAEITVCIKLHIDSHSHSGFKPLYI